MVFWYARNDIYFYLVLDFPADISALIISGFCDGVCHQYHILQLKCHLHHPKNLKGLWRSHNFFIEHHPAGAIQNGNLVNLYLPGATQNGNLVILYLPNWHASMVKYESKGFLTNRIVFCCERQAFNRLLLSSSVWSYKIGYVGICICSPMLFLDNSDSPSIVEQWSQKTWCSIITSLLQFLFLTFVLCLMPSS